MKIPVFLVSVVLVALQIHAQSGSATKDDLPALRWSSLLPKVERCLKREQPLFDNKQGGILQRVEYRIDYDYNNEIAVGIPAGESADEYLFCADLTLEFTYPFTPPPPPPTPSLTKDEQIAASLRDTVMRHDAEELLKISESFYPKAPRPRSFTVKGYPATEYFAPPCDYIPCEVRTSVSVQLAKDRTLHLTAKRRIDHVEAFLNLIDFNALNSEITKWVSAKETLDKIKGPPVSEKP